MVTLVLNPGSSSLKFAGFDMRLDSEKWLGGGEIERIGSGQSQFRMYSVDGRKTSRAVPCRSVPDAAKFVIKNLHAIRGADEPDMVVCRVVHGGSRYTEPTVVTPDVLDGIQDLSELAPLHIPIAVAVIRSIQAALPDTSVVGVFDTAFHHTLPDVSRLYALPTDLACKFGIQRYGFHGISHQYVSSKLASMLDWSPNARSKGKRVISCHLGHGASVCAIKGGKSIDTSMGFTPLEGLMMGTRCGDIDPGILTYLSNHGMDSERIDCIMNVSSGLKGVSGSSDDVRDLEKAAALGDERAQLALDMFAYRVRKYIGAYAAALGGVDAIIFCAGIGENCSQMRMRICKGLEFLGVQINAMANDIYLRSEPCCISCDWSRVGVWVVPTDECLQMAREAHASTLARLNST